MDPPEKTDGLSRFSAGVCLSLPKTPSASVLGRILQRPAVRVRECYDYGRQAKIQCFLRRTEFLVGKGLAWFKLRLQAENRLKASRSPDRTGVCCPGQGAPSQREMVIGLGFRSLSQLGKAGGSLCNVPDQGRIRPRPPFVLPFSASGWGHLGNVS